MKQSHIFLENTVSRSSSQHTHIYTMYTFHIQGLQSKLFSVQLDTSTVGVLLVLTSFATSNENFLLPDFSMPDTFRKSPWQWWHMHMEWPVVASNFARLWLYGASGALVSKSVSLLNVLSVKCVK